MKKWRHACGNGNIFMAALEKGSGNGMQHPSAQKKNGEKKIMVTCGSWQHLLLKKKTRRRQRQLKRGRHGMWHGALFQTTCLCLCSTFCLPATKLLGHFLPVYACHLLLCALYFYLPILPGFPGQGQGQKQKQNRQDKTYLPTSTCALHGGTFYELKKNKAAGLFSSFPATKPLLLLPPLSLPLLPVPTTTLPTS